MTRQTRNRAGFSVLEAVVAMWLVSVGLLALAVTMNTALATNRRTGERQRALELAQQQLDRIRSLPYNKVGLGAPDLDLARSNGNGVTDWYTAYCPLPVNCADSSAAGGRMITAPDLVVGSSYQAGLIGLNAKDPRRSKIPEVEGNSNATRTQTSNSTYFANGITLYTYVYWPLRSDGSISQQWKVVTVLARYADPPSTLSSARQVAYSTVRITGIVLDNPGLGQVPSS